MKTDKVTLQVLANHTRAAAETMAYTLYRTAHSTFVKETEDFTVQLLAPDGKTVAVPLDLGATWYPGLDYGAAIGMVHGGYEHGDIGCTNDPYSGYLATHSPDLHLWKPVFYGDEIVCWAAGHIHNTDVGGAVPASLSRSLTEIHQEGIRVPPSKLYKAGVLNDEMLAIMLLNVRKPEQNLGDLKAFVGAMNTGERKAREMIAAFGVDVFRQGLHDLMEYSEHQARQILASIPDGDYAFADFVDEDSVDGHPCRLALKLTIRGTEAVMDFTGTDPQLTSGINVPTGGNPRHTLMLVGVYYVLYTLNPNILLNYGLTRPFTCILPEGTVVNPRFPAAVGMRSLTCGRLRSLIFGAFSLAILERMPAAPAGSSSIMNVMTTDNRTGRTMIAAIDPIVGGAGGMPFADGPDGSGADASYLKNTPVEINEAEVPIKIIRYGLAPDSGGAGRWRGGLASLLEFQVFAPDTRITARNRDRCRFRPWGTLGGKAGKPSDFILNPGAPNERVLGNTDIVTCNPGDVLRIFSPGGGGRGSPLDRPADAVLADVRRGFVSTGAARLEYGVVVTNGAVDAGATALRRAEMAGAAPGGHFDFGPEREAFETVWSDATYAVLTAILTAAPIHWRFFVKTRLFEALRDEPGLPLERAFARLQAQHPALQHPALQQGAAGP